MDIYERFGRLQERYDQESEAHVQTIAVLRALKQGELSLEQLAVGDDNSWTYAPTLRVVVEDDPEGAEQPASAMLGADHWEQQAADALATSAAEVPAAS